MMTETEKAAWVRILKNCIIIAKRSGSKYTDEVVAAHEAKIRLLTTNPVEQPARS